MDDGTPMVRCGSDCFSIRGSSNSWAHGFFFFSPFFFFFNTWRDLAWRFLIENVRHFCCTILECF